MLGVHARRSVRAMAIPTARAFRTNVPAASSLEIPASAASASPGGAPELDLANPRIAFQASSSYELARGIAILTVCSQPLFVRNAEAILTLTRRWLGGPLTMWKPAAQRLRPIRLPACPAHARSSSSRPPAASASLCRLAVVFWLAGLASLISTQAADRLAASSHGLRALCGRRDAGGDQAAARPAARLRRRRHPRLRCRGRP